MSKGKAQRLLEVELYDYPLHSRLITPIQKEFSRLKAWQGSIGEWGDVWAREETPIVNWGRLNGAYDKYSKALTAAVVSPAVVELVKKSQSDIATELSQEWRELVRSRKHKKKGRLSLLTGKRADSPLEELIKKTAQISVALAYRVEEMTRDSELQKREIEAESSLRYQALDAEYAARLEGVMNLIPLGDERFTPQTLPVGCER